jgi:hypothetical protein
LLHPWRSCRIAALIAGIGAGRRPRNRNTAAAHILDRRPKAKQPPAGNMLAMNPPHSTLSSSARRFLLLPEDDLGNSARPAQRPVVRRYRLAGIGRGGRALPLDGSNLAAVRIAGEFGRLRSFE